MGEEGEGGGGSFLVHIWLTFINATSMATKNI